jgi:hypothetical protein
MSKERQSEREMKKENINTRERKIKELYQTGRTRRVCSVDKMPA